MNDAIWDVIVAGAGAAGLMAALRAAERDRRVLLLEKNRRPGLKILMSGGTRCNITQATDNRGIVEEYGVQGKFLHSPLASFSVADAIAFFEGEGVATKVEETGKVFPVSNKASDVLDALVNRVNRSGATTAFEEALDDVALMGDDPAGARFRLTTSRRELLCAKLILTTGGLSYPGSGTTGDGYRIARKLGHAIVPTYPALVPLTTNEPWVASLRGITLPDVAVSILEGEKRLTHRRGSLLFAHFGLSGPVVLDVSRAVARHGNPQSLKIRLDLLPDWPEEKVEAHLRDLAQTAGKKQLAGVLSANLPRRLLEELLRRAGLDPERKAAALSKEDRGKLTGSLKRLDLPVTGTMGYRKAEVTCGGVDLREVDTRRMESKIVPGLFFAGEVLDLDGPIGGFNFQAAWSTGWLAGSSV